MEPLNTQKAIEQSAQRAMENPTQIDQILVNIRLLNEKVLSSQQVMKQLVEKVQHYKEKSNQLKQINKEISEQLNSSKKDENIDLKNKFENDKQNFQHDVAKLNDRIVLLNQRIKFETELSGVKDLDLKKSFFLAEEMISALNQTIKEYEIAIEYIIYQSSSEIVCNSFLFFLKISSFV